jgi:hypothetical protein
MNGLGIAPPATVLVCACVCIYVCVVSLTYRLSPRSVLLPTSTIITSFPLSDLTSSIHREVLINEARSIEQNPSKKNAV